MEGGREEVGKDAGLDGEEMANVESGQGGREAGIKSPLSAGIGDAHGPGRRKRGRKGRRRRRRRRRRGSVHVSG